MLLKFSNSEKSTTFNNGKGKGKAAKGRLYGDCQVHGRPIEVSLRLISASILKIRQLKKKKTHHRNCSVFFFPFVCLGFED